MSKTLYRVYRPQKFSDVIGQNHIVQTLQNAITSNRIGHAYIFTGPRGTGKTTVARLFAVAVNTQKRKGFPGVSKDVAKRLTDGQSMDIIEIDAASNTGVDDIRKLKETVNVTPTEAKYKVYIIDEVHMLSTNAFNALLKTLEEPPEHAIFILATTEIHKVPETILSRCQRFDFARFSVDNIIKKLTIIAKKEKIKISREALEMIAISANGGMRDAESLLAQVFALENKNITAKEVSHILGTTTSTDTLALIDAFIHSDTETALKTIEDVVRGGYNIETFIKSIIEKLRIVLFLSLEAEYENIQNLISIPSSEIDVLRKGASQSTPTNIIMMIEECVIAFQKTKSTTIAQLPLEVATITICSQSQKQKNNSQKKHADTQNRNAKTQQTKKIDITLQKNTKKKSVRHFSIAKNKKLLWKKCISKIDEENKSLSHLLAQCILQEISKNTITLTAPFSFYKDKITQAKNHTVISDTIQNVFGISLKINVTVQEKKVTPSSELLSYATHIMGSSPVTQ